MDIDTLPGSVDPDRLHWGLGRLLGPGDLTTSMGSAEQMLCAKLPAASDEGAEGCGSDLGNCLETGLSC